MSNNGLYTINTGTYPNDATGDPLQTAFTKVNYNFGQLASEIASGAGSGVVTTALVSPSQGAPQNWLALQGAVDEVAGTGGGRVAIAGFEGVIPMSAGVLLQDNVIIQGAGYNGVTGRPGPPLAPGGTVLQGDGTFPMFYYNIVDSTVAQPTVGAFLLTCVSNVQILDLAIDNVSYGIQVGAINRGGFYDTILRNIAVSNWNKWAFWIENFQICYFEILTALNSAVPYVGAIRFGTSSGNVANLGNSTINRVFAQASPSAIPVRTLSVIARPNTGTIAGVTNSPINDINGFDWQGNSGTSAAVTQAATWSAGSPTVLSLAANIQYFPVDCPISVTSTAGGLNVYQTYFVLTNSGGTGAGTITVGNLMGTSSTLTLSAGVTLITYGFPVLEINGYGDGCLVQNASLEGLDLEGFGPTLYAQNAIGSMQVGINSAVQQGSSGARQSSSYVFRFSGINLQTNYYSRGTVDDDSNAVEGNALNIINGVVDDNPATASATFVQNKFTKGQMTGSGTVIKGALNLTNLLRNGNNFQGVGVDNYSVGMIYPFTHLADGMRYSNSTSLGMESSYFGIVAYTGTMAASWTINNPNNAAVGGLVNSYSGAWVGVLNIGTANVTFGSGGVDTVTMTASSSHIAVVPGTNYPVGAQVFFTPTTGTGITANTPYYVVVSTSTYIEVSATVGGGAITPSGNSSGGCSIYYGLSFAPIQNIVIPPGGYGELVFTSNGTSFGWCVRNLQNGAVIPAYLTVGALPGTPITGMRYMVVDADAPTFGDTVTGGSSTVVPVFYNGSNWTVG